MATYKMTKPNFDSLIPSLMTNFEIYWLKKYKKAKIVMFTTIKVAKRRYRNFG